MFMELPYIYIYKYVNIGFRVSGFKVWGLGAYGVGFTCSLCSKERRSGKENGHYCKGPV